MITINYFIDFCVLVKKGLSFLFDALFLMLKKVVLTPFLTIFYAWKGISLIFILCLFISKFVVDTIILISNPFVSGILYTFLYALYGLKIISLILLNFVKYVIKGVNIVAKLLYKFLKYVFNGFIDVSIFVYKIVTFIPNAIIRAIIKFFNDIGDTLNKFIIKPIQDISDWIIRTYKHIVKKLKALPNDIKTGFKKWYKNLTFVKHLENKKDLNRQVLLIDFNSKDAERADEKIIWQYSARSKEGKFVKGTFEAFSKVDVHSFLMSEGYEVYDIKTSKWIEFIYGGQFGSGKKLNKKKLIFFLTQLSTYIKAGIPLTEAVRILSNQEKSASIKRLYQSIIYELIMGENFSSALEKQGEAFPRLLVNMLKTSEMTGELAETLDDMSDYYDATMKLRKQTLTSMMYPMIVLFFVVVVLIFILIFVIPQFVQIYKDSDSDLPQITTVTIALSDFLQNYILLLLAGIVLFALLFRFLFKHVKFFKTIIQYLIMHIPVVKNVIIYNEITMFTKTFSSLLKHNVYITESMEILSKITNNEIYKMVVFDAITNIAKGDNISDSFKNNWAIPPLAYEMMLTGERTGQLPLMMGKVAIYYQEEQKNLVNQIKTLIEPIVIVVLTVAVGLILMAVVIPMFNLYSNISAGV